MVSNRKFELFKIDKIIKCFSVNPTRKFQMFSLLLIATLTGVIFQENIITELLPPVQALSLRLVENDVIIQVGDDVEPKTRIFRGNIGTSFFITSGKKNGLSDASYKILLNGKETSQINQALNSRSKEFKVEPGTNLYTIVDEKSHKIIDEFIISTRREQGIEKR